MKEQIIKEVRESNFQPTFIYTDSIDEAVDSINIPHEDYDLDLDNIVKSIIEKELSNGFNDTTNHPFIYSISLNKIFEWQKEILKVKQEKAALSNKSYHNLYIKTGLRTHSVKVGNWNPPPPLYLQEFSELLFPIQFKRDLIESEEVIYQDNFLNLRMFKDTPYPYNINDNEADLIPILTEWYKYYQTVHFLEDFNGRTGGIVINILSYLITGKYLINEKYLTNGR